MRFSPFNLAVLFILSILVSCGPKKPKIHQDFEVVMRIPSEPTGLNSIVNRDGMKGMILQYIMFQPLTIDPISLQMLPLVANDQPLVETQDDGSVKVTLSIRPEAKWDNGSQITAKDVAFSLKLCVLNGIQNAAIKSSFQNVSNFIFYPEDSLKYSIVFAKPYFLAPIIAGDMNLFPEYVYDSTHILAKYSVEDVLENGEAIANDSEVIAFAENFNSEIFQRTIVQGCGPYIFKEWQEGKRIILEKKANWWGDDLSDVSVLFKAFPTRIIFEVIKDEATAIQALKQGKIDGMATIDFKTFALTLKGDSLINKNFNFYSPNMLAFEYFGINSRRPYLDNLEMRRAIAYAIPTEHIIDNLLYGLGNKINTYISSVREVELNKMIPYNIFDIQKGNELLERNGWMDSDGDGKREKIINGKKVVLNFTFLVNAGNERREKTALLIKDQLAQIGVGMEIATLEMDAYINALMKGNFDFVLSGTLGSALETDPFQLWHSASAGGNFTGFGNSYTDSLISTFRNEMDPQKRIQISKTLQQEVYNYSSVIFINDMKERIVFSKKFKDLTVSEQRPGYWLGSVLPN